MIREGAILPTTIFWQFSKSRLHHIPELPYNMVNSKINHPTLQVQNEGAYCQQSNGPHGCEVPSEDNAYGSPLPLPLRVIPPVMLCTLSFYTWIVLFFCHTLSNYFVVSRWNNNCPCCWYVILFVWPWSRCAIFLVSGHQQTPCISVTSQQLNCNRYCLLHHINVKFHYIWNSSNVKA